MMTKRPHRKDNRKNNNPWNDGVCCRVFSISLTGEYADILREWAASEGVTPSELIRKLLWTHGKEKASADA